MASHGGTRTGAGRPQGGVSQSRRLINTAITRGLAHAGRIRYPDQVNGADLDEAATQTAAMIVSDMIQAGQGNDVIKIWSQVATKDNDKETASKNVLAEALARLPARSQVPDESRNNTADDESLINTWVTDGGTTDYKSGGTHNQPYFAPQGCLLLDGLEDDQTQSVTINQPAD